MVVEWVSHLRPRQTNILKHFLERPGRCAKVLPDHLGRHLHVPHPSVNGGNRETLEITLRKGEYRRLTGVVAKSSIRIHIWGQDWIVVFKVKESSSPAHSRACSTVKLLWQLPQLLCLLLYSYFDAPASCELPWQPVFLPNRSSLHWTVKQVE